jgi:uncharacterized membrane protein
VRRPIETADWWPAVVGLLLLGVPKVLFASDLSDAWKGYGGLLSIGLGACLLGIGGYRINKWARGH